jgi:hypothetical protein
MTNMLCSLASGRVVVALEVLSLFFSSIHSSDRSVGGLQPGIHLKFSVSRREGFVG